MHRFFAEYEGNIGELVSISEEDTLHARRVLRLGEGDQIELICPPCRVLACIEDAGAAQIRARITEILPSTEPGTRVTLYQGLPKADKMEWIIQKGTEIGCSRFCPVQMQRSVVQLNPKDAEKKAERLRKIAREAVKQCGRTAVPTVDSAVSLSTALQQMTSESILLIPWENARDGSIADALCDLDAGQSVGIVIGPEGGISQEEIDRLTALPNARLVTLGPRILRTETAALVSLTMVLDRMGDLGAV